MAKESVAAAVAVVLCNCTVQRGKCGKCTTSMNDALRLLWALFGKMENCFSFNSFSLSSMSFPAALSKKQCNSAVCTCDYPSLRGDYFDCDDLESF